MRADIDDAGAIRELLAGTGERGIDVGQPIAAKRIGDEIDDAHDEWARGILPPDIAQDQLHGSGTKEIFRF